MCDMGIKTSQFPVKIIDTPQTDGNDVLGYFATRKKGRDLTRLIDQLEFS